MSEQKEFSANLGGKKRIFKYTMRERSRIEEQFGKGLMELVKSDLIPNDEAGVPTGGGRLKVQVALIHAGIRHGGKAVTLERVNEWLEQYVAHGGIVQEIYAQCALAIMSSGALGFVYEQDDEEEEDAGDGEGKAEAETST